MSDLDDKKLLEAIYAGVSLNKLAAVPKGSTNWFKATSNGDVYEFVIDPEPTKQAFIDAGWIPKDVADKSIRVERVYSVGLDVAPPEVGYDAAPEQHFGKLIDLGDTQEYIVPDNPRAFTTDHRELMTGQEWYDKFRQLLSPWSDGAYSGNSNAVIEAAKKAAGVE